MRCDSDSCRDKFFLLSFFRHVKDKFMKVISIYHGQLRNPKFASPNIHLAGYPIGPTTEPKSKCDFKVFSCSSYLFLNPSTKSNSQIPQVGICLLPSGKVNNVSILPAPISLLSEYILQGCIIRVVLETIRPNIRLNDRHAI